MAAEKMLSLFFCQRTYPFENGNKTNIKIASMM